MSNNLIFWVLEGDYERQDKYLPKNSEASKLCELLGKKNMAIPHSLMDKIWELADCLGISIDFVASGSMDCVQDCQEKFNIECVG